jgi:hypothetical protein
MLNIKIESSDHDMNSDVINVNLYHYIWFQEIYLNNFLFISNITTL